MSRIIHESGDVLSEAFSPTTELQWSPGTLDGQVVFRPERITSINGRVLARTPEQALIVPFADALPRLYPVTLPDGTQAELPGIVAMQIIRAAFDFYYNARSTDDAVEVEARDPEPLPELAAPERTR